MYLEDTQTIDSHEPSYFTLYEYIFYWKYGKIYLSIIINKYQVTITPKIFHKIESSRKMLKKVSFKSLQQHMLPWVYFISDECHDGVDRRSILSVIIVVITGGFYCLRPSNIMLKKILWSRLNSWHAIKVTRT